MMASTTATSIKVKPLFVFMFISREMVLLNSKNLIVAAHNKLVCRLHEVCFELAVCARRYYKHRGPPAGRQIGDLSTLSRMQADVDQILVAPGIRRGQLRNIWAVPSFERRV